MKTAIKISVIAAMLLALPATAQEKSIWQRVNVGATFNSIPVTYYAYQYGSGFLTNRPDRALNATASIRLWNRLEAGGYLSLMHCSPFGSLCYDDNFSRYTWYDNNLNLTGGIYAELHAIRFDRRLQRHNNVDYVLRGGFGLGGETDGVWGGFGMEVGFTKQMKITLYYDYGGFAYSNIVDNVSDFKPYRISLGLKVNLK